MHFLIVPESFYRFLSNFQRYPAYPYNENHGQRKWCERHFANVSTTPVIVISALEIALQKHIQNMFLKTLYQYASVVRMYVLTWCTSPVLQILCMLPPVQFFQKRLHRIKLASPGVLLATWFLTENPTSQSVWASKIKVTLHLQKANANSSRQNSLIIMTW